MSISVAAKVIKNYLIHAIKTFIVCGILFDRDVEYFLKFDTGTTGQPEAGLGNIPEIHVGSIEKVVRARE